MAQFEYEFSNQDKELVLTQDDSHVFGGTDYIRLTIYPTEAIDNIVTLVGDGGKITKAVFYSSLYNESTTGLEINTSAFQNNLTITPKRIGITSDGSINYNDFKIYTNETGTLTDIYIKPNEIFNNFGLPQGNYKIQVDFLNQLKPDIYTTDDSVGEHFEFVIKQISTSRKEVRLKLLNTNILNNSDIISKITNLLNTDQNNVVQETYQFKYVLNIGTGDHIQIMNYEFDKITDGKNNQSIILKLYNPLPTSISNLKLITIEKEVITTQIQDIFYFSEVPDVFFGDGLETDFNALDNNSDNNNIGFQSIDELAYSSSIGDVEINSLISQSQYNYPNLNTDFREFANHTFFGSAKKKLENFKTKVKTIQGYYSDISSSLSLKVQLLMEILHL